MNCKNVSFKANYLANPALLQQPKTYTPVLNSVLAQDSYTKKPAVKTAEERKKDEMIKVAYLMATLAFGLAGLSYIKSRNVELSFESLLKKLKNVGKNVGSHTPNIPPPVQGGANTGSGRIFRSDMWEDLSQAAGLSDLTLADDLADLAKRTTRMITNPSLIKERGGKVSSSILLYGPPGTGKTTFAKALAKSVPNSEFASIDIARLGSEYVSVTERNLNEAIDEICSVASVDKAKKIFVFLDEIDSIMMVDPGTGAKRSNDLLNVFKKGMTEKFAKLENIIVVAATNLSLDDELGRVWGGKQLDKPMLDRFKNKIYVGLPTKEQIHGAIVKHYQDGACKLVDEGMKDINSPKLKKLAAFLEKHKISFRTLESLYQDAATAVKNETEKLSITDFINAIKAKSTELKISLKDIDALVAQMA